MTGRTCLVCGHSGLDPHLDILLKCPTCGFVTARIEGPVDSRSLYGDDYFSGSEYLDYRADESFFRKNFRKRLAEVRRHRSSGRLLEIGSAYGFFLDLARAYFDVVGFEVNHEAARFGRDEFGLDIRTDDFLQIDPAALGEPFDVTVMWDVIEHLERPDDYVARIAAHSKPDALLHITTGDIGSRVARWRGRKWRLIHPPSHLHYFDRRTITRLLSNHGFEVVDIHSADVARSLRQILYSLLVLGLKAPRAYALVRGITPAAWGFALNTGDIMHVTARKSP